MGSREGAIEEGGLSMPANRSSAAQGLLALAIGTAIADYFIWAAFHDITRGETDPTTEYVFLALCGT